MRLNSLALVAVMATAGVSVNAFVARPLLLQPGAAAEYSALRLQAKKPTGAPAEAASEPPTKTLGGGEGLLFEMARRMSVWNEDEDQASSAASQKSANVLPRWHPHAGISDVNPAFRTQAPIMNNQGYAGTIWRNVRKRDKPSLWRHALRTYERMKKLELDVGRKEQALKIFRSNIHYEGALLACAKLAKWQKALEIYGDAVNKAAETATETKPMLKVEVTDNMIMSLISACVRGCKKMDGREASVEERRVPLDACRNVILSIEDHHDLPLVALYLNPLAAAYQSLGLISDASVLLKEHLADRASGPEDENGDDPFNIHDMHARDKASYALLVKGAVSDGDWAGAVDALRDMTEAGSFPSARNLNAWTEVSERKSRQRNTRSRKKKRDGYWVETVR